MADDDVDLGRRAFLRGNILPGPPPVRPPWSRDETIVTGCTSCGACLAVCPQTILRFDGRRQPEIDFSRGECTFCGRCAEACPEPLFDRTAPPFRHVALIGEACFAARGVVCQSCGDACPETAIRFRPRRGGPALPALDADRCTGCGACIAACPAEAIGVRHLAAEGAHV